MEDPGSLISRATDVLYSSVPLAGKKSVLTLDARTRLVLATRRTWNTLQGRLGVPPRI